MPLQFGKPWNERPIQNLTQNRLQNLDEYNIYIYICILWFGFRNLMAAHLRLPPSVTYVLPFYLTYIPAFHLTTYVLIIDSDMISS